MTNLRVFRLVESPRIKASRNPSRPRALFVYRLPLIAVELRGASNAGPFSRLLYS